VANECLLALYRHPAVLGLLERAYAGDEEAAAQLAVLEQRARDRAS